MSSGIISSGSLSESSVGLRLATKINNSEVIEGVIKRVWVRGVRGGRASQEVVKVGVWVREVWERVKRL